MFAELPASAAWRHQDALDGFEVVFFESHRTGCQLIGHTAAVEAGRAWAVRYSIELDEHWHTRSAHVQGWSHAGQRDLLLQSEDEAVWWLDGSHLPELDGCWDVDLESSSCTNMIPVHRLALDVGQRVEAPAVYVRALGLDVERLEQQYMRIDDDGVHQRFDYLSPAFDFECVLTYDEAGLVLEYPGIAARVL